ncbi:MULTISPECIES: hypothetical protein [Streptomyces]|uniref:Uncharacterized protein n=1 Tax=Streptomyces huasconensis TaxID=1854574 RepID=A0ABV3LMZ2_9ACTN|nr:MULTISPECIES: hypothetical protein [Streptomyces]UFQ17701.1 hypothetical protein J2N69_23370 [Streptomyces huasconensis]WCL87308.1 hypothetical protein PPN52_23375 [Streptomyces sp. JCM 35825]
MPSVNAHLAMTHLVPLAKEVDDDKVTPGVLGFIVFAVMALAVWGLMKSMSRHMGKVDFKEPETDGEREAGDGPVGAATGENAASGAKRTGTGK